MNRTHIFFIFLFLSAYFFFSVSHLTQFITADEHYWLYERVPKYWDALNEGKWLKTAINDKPGISVALLSGMGLFFEPHPKQLCFRDKERVLSCDTQRTESLLFAFRFPLIFCNALLLLYLAWIIAKISRPIIAVGSVLFLIFSPELIGISQVVNPDALLWSLSAATLFSYFALLRYGEKKYVFLTGLFLGFTILSKYTGSILIPFFLLVGILGNISNVFSPKEEKFSSPQIKRFLWHYFIVVLLALFTILLFFPALWFRPSQLVTLLSGGGEAPLFFVSFGFFLLFCADVFLCKGFFLSLFRTTCEKISSFRVSRFVLPYGLLLLFLILIGGRLFISDWQIFERVPFYTKELTRSVSHFGPTPTLFQSMLLETNPLVFSLTPITLFFFFIFLFRFPFFNKKDSSLSFIAGTLLFFLPLYMASLIMMDVLATPRYLIMLYPIIAFLAACGLEKTLIFCEEKFPKIRKYIQKIFLGSVFIFACISLSGAAPFYLTYANILLPREHLISHAWGYGGYEAAQYLNALPNAEKLLIWTDYEGVCEFFKGKCIIKQYTYAAKQSAHIDYAVLTKRGRDLYSPDHINWTKEGKLFMKPAYDEKNPLWQLFINDRPGNFVTIVKIRP